MDIAIIGTGYVGLVQGVILADFGHNVICVDIDCKKIDDLKKGIIPIYEPGLAEVLERNLNSERLSFTTDIQSAVEKSSVIFVAVGTPPQDDGSADLVYVLDVANSIGKYANSYKVIVDKSTVPVGTGNLVRLAIQKQLEERGVDIDFDVVSNPEFLREGKAIKDCQTPDRVVIGCESERAMEEMRKVYNVLYINETPFLFTDIATAEMIKYASNAFLAVKISFINEMALLSEKVGANVQEIARAMGMDGRISPKFLHAGPGYGGSCFPKDTLALLQIAQKNNEECLVVKAAVEANEKQKQRMILKIADGMGDLKGKRIGILGLSFKPETDDMREAPALAIIEGLVKMGAIIQAFCPKGMEEAKWRLENIDTNIIYCNDEYSAITGVDGAVIMTEWSQFRGMNLARMKELMYGNSLFDLRNIHVKDYDVRTLFNYFPVGRN